MATLTEYAANVNYYRVCPRDLFNEAKLLKCMGRLCLYILDGITPVEMTNSDNGKGFKIGLLDEGSLTITNLTIKIKGKPYLFKTTYNSKANYPLFLQTEDYEDILVFDDEGNFDADFISFCNSIQ